MKVLILGFSSIAQRKVIPALEKLKLVSEIEIASKSKKVTLRGKLTKKYTSYKEAIIHSNAEIVYISLPNSLHYKYSEMCLLNSKNVIVDKPSILNRDELEKLMLIVKEKKLTINESAVYFYHKAVKKFININKKEKGILIATKDNFRNSISLGGGALNDMAVYASSVGRHFWGSNSKSLTVSVEKKHRLDISFSVLANYGQGRDMIGYFGFEKNYSNNLTFIGNSKKASLERVFSAPDEFNSKIIINKSNNRNQNIIDIGSDDSFYNFLNNVLKNIKLGQLKLLNNEFYKSNLETLKVMEFKNK
jgi:predicted dehydrogenase